MCGWFLMSSKHMQYISLGPELSPSPLSRFPSFITISLHKQTIQSFIIVCDNLHSLCHNTWKTTLICCKIVKTFYQLMVKCKKLISAIIPSFYSLFTFFFTDTNYFSTPFPIKLRRMFIFMKVITVLSNLYRSAKLNKYKMIFAENGVCLFFKYYHCQTLISKSNILRSTQKMNTLTTKNAFLQLISA